MCDENTVVQAPVVCTFTRPDSPSPDSAKSAWHIIRVQELDSNDDDTTQRTGEMRDSNIHFPPKRKLRWIALGFTCALCLLILYKSTGASNWQHSQLSLDLDPVLDSSQVRENIYRRNYVKQMMRHAWANYAAFAWGDNELRPLTRNGFAGVAPFGDAKLGLTIIDSLDTLHLMGLHGELANATDWIKTRFNLRNAASIMSVFEANIRLLGGFLSIHALTGEKIYMEKAIDTANALMPAFESPSELPWSLIEVNSGRGSLYNWITSECVFLADAGTLHLEFSYLSEITGNAVYLDKVNKVRQLLKQTKSMEGLYPNLVDFHDKSGSKCKTGVSVSVGAFGDSFYEYLWKAWLTSGKTDFEAKKMFYNAMRALEDNLLQTSVSGFKYFAKLGESKSLTHEMEHLACFIGGLYALAAQDSDSPAHFLQLAQDLTLTCRFSYNTTVSKLGPEVFIFDKEGYPSPRVDSSRQYSLRPEVIESYFYLWKLTGNKKYREWAWDAVQAIEKHCRKRHGYSGIFDVDVPSPVADNVQQSFFMAETLKYLYLIFDDSKSVPLDTWVFNTEAHPLPVIGSQPFKEAFKAWRGLSYSPLYALNERRIKEENDRLSATEERHLPADSMLQNSADLGHAKVPVLTFCFLYVFYVYGKW